MNMSIVFQPSRPGTGSPLYEEHVIAVRLEPDLHFESYLRDVTDEMRSPWKFRCGVKEFADGVQRCAETREYGAACFHAIVATTRIVEIPTVQEQMDDLTGNSRASGCGNAPHQIHRSGLVENSFM